MSKLIEKIEDEILNHSPGLFEESKIITKALRAFRAFITDAERDLDEESFSEYEQNALAVWEDE